MLLIENAMREPAVKIEAVVEALSMVCGDTNQRVFEGVEPRHSLHEAPELRVEVLNLCRIDLYVTAI